MKNRIFVIVLYMCLLILLGSFMLRSNQKVELIEEGKCLGLICIEKTTPGQIIEQYGDGKVNKFKKRYEQKRGYASRKWLTLEYEKLGLKFTAGSMRSPIYSIEVSSPFQAKTEKGIVLGLSGSEDIIKAYGLPGKRGNSLKRSYKANDNTYYVCCDSIYFYPALGIDFTLDCDTTFVTENGKAKPENTSRPACFIVKKINIYSPFNP
jgi:hypothetical protein